jgi:ribosome modulation factor
MGEIAGFKEKLMSMCLVSTSDSNVPHLTSPQRAGWLAGWQDGAALRRPPLMMMIGQSGSSGRCRAPGHCTDALG